jgi:hypothetical protein
LVRKIGSYEVEGLKVLELLLEGWCEDEADLYILAKVQALMTF